MMGGIYIQNQVVTCFNGEIRDIATLGRIVDNWLCYTTQSNIKTVVFDRSIVDWAAWQMVLRDNVDVVGVCRALFRVAKPTLAVVFTRPLTLDTEDIDKIKSLQNNDKFVGKVIDIYNQLNVKIITHDNVEGFNYERLLRY